MGKPSRTEIHALPMNVLVRIVNEWGDAPRAGSSMSGDPYPDASALKAESPETWSRFGPLDETTLIETANLVRPIFAATSAGECVERLNALMSQTGMTPAVAADDWTVREAWYVSRPDRELLANAVLSVLHHLRDEPDVRRLGSCDSDECVDVYVDQSPGGRRRYCCVTCQNRNRARAYRAARRAAVRN